MDRKSNEQVLDAMGQPAPLEAAIVRLKLSYFGHVLRAGGLESDVMLGKVEGHRQRGGPSAR